MAQTTVQPHPPTRTLLGALGLLGGVLVIPVLILLLLYLTWYTGPAPADPQTVRIQNLAEVQSQQKWLLTTYGWSDRDAGKVRIPIAAAMDKLLAEGIATTQAAPTTQGAP